MQITYWFYTLLKNTLSIGLMAMFLVISTAMVCSGASLNEIMQNIVSGSQLSKGLFNNPKANGALSNEPSEAIAHENTVEISKDPKQLIEEKIKSEFHTAYGDNMDVIFVNWRLPRLKDPKTGHWNLNKSNPTGAPSSFRIDTIEINSDRTKLKAKVFYQNNHQEKHFLVRGRIDHLIDIPVLNRSVHYGDLIKTDDITWQKVSDRKSGRYLIMKAEDMVGRHPKGRYIKAGIPVQKQDLALPLYVDKGDYVTIHYQTGNVNLELKGKSLDKGHMGDTIRILNETSRKIIHAQVNGPSSAIMH